MPNSAPRSTRDAEFHDLYAVLEDQGCECRDEHLRQFDALIDQRDRYRATLEKIALNAVATTGVPDKHRLIGIAQEVSRALG